MTKLSPTAAERVLEAANNASSYGPDDCLNEAPYIAAATLRAAVEQAMPLTKTPWGSVAGAIPVGFVYVDGQSIGEITESSLKDRRILGEEGFISVVVVIESQTGKIVAGPDIHARGFTEDNALFNEVTGMIEKALATAVANGINGTNQLQQVVRKTVGSWVGDKHGRKPMIVPVVIEV